MARAKTRYTSKKARSRAMSQAYDQYSRAMNSLNEKEVDSFGAPTDASRYQRSQVQAVRDMDIFGEYPTRQDRVNFAKAKNKVRSTQLLQAYINRTDKIMQAKVGG